MQLQENFDAISTKFKEVNQQVTCLTESTQIQQQGELIAKKNLLQQLKEKSTNLEKVNQNIL